jgi:polyisoprenoid-binding protein YceI
MKARRLFVNGCLTFIAAALLSFTIVMRKWTQVTEEVKISFSVPARNHSGTISGLKTSIEFNPLDPRSSAIIASVDVNTITTDHAMLTHHLKTDDFFDVAHHPEIKFSTDSVLASGDGFVAYGKLSMRDSIHPVSIPFHFVKGENRSVFTGNFSLYAGDYGVGKKYSKEKDFVRISIEVPVIQE